MELVSSWKGENMLNKEECQKACLYLLKHCYETDAPALENGEEGKTYTSHLRVLKKVRFSNN